MLKTNFLTEYVEKRKQENHRRQMRMISSVDGVEIVCNDSRLINFSSNDYLGLSQHPLLHQRAIEYVSLFGTGSGASRLVTGNYAFHEAVESKIAALIGTETALLFNSGYQANVTLLSALADRHSLILADRSNHNSLQAGALASRAKILRYRHGDMAHLELLLQRYQKPNLRIWIVTESLFSMDGDQTDLDLIIALADKYQALVYIDDAHAIGIMGHRGMGQAAGKKGIDLIMGTFGKAAGAFGAFVACSHQMREYIIQACPGLIYTTALPPAIIGSIDAALDLIPTMIEERQKLKIQAEGLRETLRALGFNIGFSTTHLIPIILGDADHALSLSKYLERNGMLVAAIRPPTVPHGTSRLRLALSLLHTEDHLHKLLGALKQWTATR